MSQALLICFRNKIDKYKTTRLIQKLSEHLSPDNIVPNPPYTSTENSLALAVFNPISETITNPRCIAVGKIIGNCREVETIGAPAPDGSFALFRVSRQFVELVPDAASSRRIWYAQTPELFIAATCQRAILPFLGNFDPNPTAVAWRLSSGHLGPGLSWDKRIHPLPCRTSLSFNRQTWTANTKHESFRFIKKSGKSHAEQVEYLHRQVALAFDESEIDPTKWIATLSGGTESRLNLLMLSKKGKYRTATYGTRSSESEKNSDADIAAQLTASLGQEHIFLETDRRNDDVSTIFDRFISLTEGQSDGIQFYMDGFNIWKNLHQSGVSGIIRGDAPFGNARTPYSEMDVRNDMFLFSINDIRRLCIFADKFPKQELSYRLKRRPNESLPMWRDRLYLHTKLPLFLSSSSVAITHYLEIFNPLISRRVIDAWSQTSDSLRNNRAVLLSLLESISPKIPYATVDTNRKYFRFLDGEESRKFLSRKIDSDTCRELFSDELIDFLISELNKPTSSALYKFQKSRTHWILSRVYERLMPMIFEPLLPSESNRLVRKPMNPGTLAFRVYSAGRMHEILREYADLFMKDIWLHTSPPILRVGGSPNTRPFSGEVETRQPNFRENRGGS